MSTNPFRQTRKPQDVPSGADSAGGPTLSDGSGSRIGNGNEAQRLSLDFKAIDPNYQRHVSFASPPVDSTLPPESYPSSPESIRSPPPNYFARTGGFATPDYRTAIQSDPFEDLTKDRQEDGILQQAVSNAETNIIVGQPRAQPEQHEDRSLWDTLSKFPALPQPVADDPTARSTLPDHGKSLDVDAFKRLLLTGNTGIATGQSRQSARKSAPPPPNNNPQSDSVARTVPDTSFPQSNPSAGDLEETNVRKASFADTFTLILTGEEKAALTAAGKIPPPAPAPRRARSVKTRDLSPLPRSLAADATNTDEAKLPFHDKTVKTPPALPLARRQSQRMPSNNSSPTTSPAEPARPLAQPPPPPPVRKQPPSAPRRPSHDLAPTIEESKSGNSSAQGSRRASIEPPPHSGSRKSSLSLKRPVQGFMSPPPVPPPRRGRGSSRSSMDGFRPSLSTFVGGVDDHGKQSTAEQSSEPIHEDRSRLNASNADSILTELASLQKEVDAARHS